MYISRVDINNYRSINKTTLNVLENQITCLIGGNGSGKSNILRAIAALKDETRVTDEFRHIGAHDDDPITIRVEFLFTDADKDLLEQYSLSTSNLRGLIVTRSKSRGQKSSLNVESLDYDGIIQSRLNKDISKLVSELTGRLLDADKEVLQPDVDVLLDTEQVSTERKAKIDLLITKVSPDPALSEDYGAALADLSTRLSQSIDDITTSIFDSLDIELLSFDKYLVENEAPLAELAAREQHPMLFDLLSLSGKTSNDFQEAQRHNRINVSESASEKIRSEIRKVWPTNKLKIIINKDQADEYLSFCARTQQGKAVLLGDLSDGEQWFLRFYTRLATARLNNKKVIWLFDEPDRGLHAKSQIDLRQFIGEISEDSQILYVTHQPNMIQWHKLERIFVVENIETNKHGESGTLIHKRFWRDNEFNSPLREVLRLFIGDEVLWGDEHVIIEGPSDYFFLTGWLNYLKRFRDAAVWYKSYISPKRTFIPVSGANNIPYFLFFLTRKSAGDVNWFTLVDSGDDYKEIMSIMSKGRLKSFRKNVATILDLIPEPKLDTKHTPTKGTSMPKFDIEDLFEADDYYKLFKEHYSTEYPSVKLPIQKDISTKKFQIAKQIEEKVKALNPELDAKYTLDKTGIAQLAYLKLTTEKKGGYFSKNSEDNFAEILKAIDKRFSKT